ncbi:ABC transporter permease [Micromonospora inositola]|uniref:Transport permease protein n=1 Tax=Micromonospora inositola TaxID=47865 RepID=A0A1C5H2Q1_9ACTN|nr:ABC transporter permease [Micromonospora inositola]SCG40173.1 ABC-2 type transport system permease protein [Micromonospora inositola]
MTTLDTGARPSRAVLTARPRPTRPGTLTACLTFGRRALLKIRRTPVQLFDVAVHPVVFTLMFTYLFGGAIGGSTGKYVGYLVPGILVMTLLVTTGTTGAALSIDIASGVFDRFRTLSIRPAALLVGALLGDVVRYAFASTVVVGLGLTLGFRPHGNVVGVAAAVLLVVAFSVSLSWVWTALALAMRSPGAVLGVTQAVLYPLAFFSNIFIAPATLPGWLRTFVDVNPITHLVTAARELMAGTMPGREIGWILAACAVLTAVFGPLSVRLLRNR